ncbi:MAG TPA: IS110 family transposase [Candidatus Paceibacterota bacterium]|jgi:transposase|nr:IS110 family transposase [Candidatus Paceibacterota bacterium]
MELKHYVGIDVSKSTLDFAVFGNGQIILQLQCENTKKSIVKAAKQLRQLSGFGMTSSVFCMEYTGIYNNHLLDYLLSCKSHVWLESALQIKQSQGIKRGKTDAIDAARIAEYAFTFKSKMRLWNPPREEVKKLRALIIMRDRIVNSIKKLKVPVKENSTFVNKEFALLEAKLMRSSIAAMEKTLVRIEKEITELIKKDPALKQLFELITSVTGVGPVIAMNIIVLTDEFKKFDDPQKFSCYAGVVPFDHRSGSSIRGKSKVSHLANKKIKTLLHLAAMSAINAKGEFQEYYKRKVAEGKNKMCVINAIRNKIIHRIFAVIKRLTPYEKKYSNPLV